MKTKSIKFRITMWYFVAFFVSAALAFAAFYYVTQQILLQQTDREISLHASQIDGSVSQEQLDHQFAQMPGMLIVIADPSGKTLTMSQNLGVSTQVVSDILEKSKGVTQPSFVNRNIGTSPMRIGVFPKNNSLVLVAHPTEVINSALARLVNFLVIVLLIVGIPAISGGYLLAGGALQPITNLSRRLKQVSSANLQEQIENRKTGDEIEELTDSFNGLLKRLSEAFEREKQFIGDVAHELKTPLATMKSSVEIGLTKNRNNDEYKKILANTLTDVNKLSATVNEVLDLAWAEAGSQRSSFTQVDLSKVLEDIYEVTEKMAEAKKIKVFKEIASEVIIAGKQDKLFRAFFNLADNAIKYTPNKGKIAISLVKEDGQITAEISNSGPGISKNDLPNIFKRFYRGSKKEGSGLGLAICKSIIEAHGGKLTVDSNPNKLTTFRILLSS